MTPAEDSYMSRNKLATHPLHSLLRSGFARAAAGALGAAAPFAVLANPSGGQVVAGSATINNAGNNGMVINQGSQRAVINWQQFNVGANQYVQFVQPNSSSVVLNRVIGGNASQIFGDIRANGQVFLVNPNGVFFAPGSSIDVQGLVASTLDLSNSDFMAGRYAFSKAAGAPDAGVDNQGIIRAGRGGYVVLAGDYSQNQGNISAEFGRVYLAAGNSAVLTMDSQQLISYKVDGATLSRLAGVNNAGEITALGGAVVMTADVARALTATAVNNTGVIAARSVRDHGGEIVLEADGSGIYNSGTLEAGAAQNGVAGGTIILDAKGGTLELTPNSFIEAAGLGAKGGFVEVSGHDVRLKGYFNVGKGGDLLIDPAKIKIVHGSASSQHSVGTTSIGTATINLDLNLGGNVTLVASNSIVFAGNAGDKIHATSGSGNLTLAIGTVSGPSCGQGGVCAADGGAPSIGHTPGGGTINVTSLPISIAGDLVIDAGGNADSGGHITAGNLTGRSVTLTADTMTVNGNIVATGGDINLTGHSGSPAITVTGTVTANNGAFKASFSNEGGAGIGTVTLHNVTAEGIFILAGHIADSGTLHAKGSGEAGGSHRDVGLHAQDEFGSHGAHINVAKIISDNGNINVTTSGNGSSTIATGPLSAVHGSVDLFTSGNATKAGGGITVTGDIHGSHVGIDARSLGGGATVTVNGNIFATDDISDSVVLSADQLGSGAAKIKVTGTITSAKGVRIFAQGSSFNNAITVGAITANTSGCPSSDCAGAGVSITTAKGTITANGDITLDKDPFKQGDINLNARVLNVGNLTANGGSINISAHTFSSVHHAGITQTAGTTLKARNINVDLNASYGGSITLGNMTASSSKGSATIRVQALSHNAANHIVVNGNIIVTGKGATPPSSRSSGMPGIGVPMAADLSLQASGSAAVAHTVKVNGNITITANPGAFNFGRSAHAHSCECASSGQTGFHVSGTKGGLAEMNVTASGSLSSVQLNGVTTLKGTDAELSVSALTIKTGALNVTGSGHITRLQISGSTASGSSKNSVGRADISLEGHGSSTATTITTGNVTVNGKGSAAVMMNGQHVTAGDIKVTATAAKGSRSGSLSGHGLGRELPGLLGLPLDKGAFNAGRAGVFIGASNGRSTSSHPNQSQTITTGNVSVTGVGEADINLAARAIATKNLTAVATKGSMHGSFFGTVEGGGNGTFIIKGGEAHIGLDGSSGNVAVTGALAVTGPTAGVDIKGTTIKVSGGVSAIASGGTDVVDRHLGSEHLHFTGPGDITGVNIGGVSSAGSVNIGGTVKVKGPGLVGVMITGHKVALGGLSASASAARKYTTLNTSDAPTTNSFTVGDVAVLVFQGSGGQVTGPATVTGNVSLNAPHGNVFLGTELNVKGQFAVNANGNVTTDVSTIAPRFNEISHGLGHSSGSGLPSSIQLPLKLTATGVSMIAGGNIDLTGATVTTTGVTALKAGADIVLSGVDLNVGTLMAYAGSTIHNGGAIGTIDANAVAFHAGKSLTLSSTDISVGSGTVPQDATTVNGNAALKAALADTAFAATLSGDPQLAAAFAAGGIPITSLAPNAAFIAGGAVSLGGLTLKGGYLYLQAASVTLGSAVTAPKGVVVQVAPASSTGTTDMEGKGASGANLNLNNTGFLDQFGDGTTLVLGASGQTGDITLGNGGSFDIGSDNLIVDTGGNVTGLGNVISTGIVSSLEALLGSAVPPPTSGEIDPTSSNNNNTAGDKKHQNQGNGEAGANGTQGGSITQSTNAGGACH
jgi:filamentous hemagglutinin family protein